MAHTKSAEKKIRQYREQRVRNNAAKSIIKKNSRKLSAAMTAKDSAAIPQSYAALCSALDKAVKRGNIKKQTAIRRKARAARAMRTATAA
jgi:small subunit ribosomal protein S20